MQDNFRGAFLATQRLIEQGFKKIAFLGCSFSDNPNHTHLEERLGGYLSALSRAGLEIRPEWKILGQPVAPAVKELTALSNRKNGPDAAVVLWPNLFEDLGQALAAKKLNIPVVVWWGCIPARRSAWSEKYPKVPLPDGISWSAEDLARTAFSNLENIRKAGGADIGRSLVNVRLIGGEEK